MTADRRAILVVDDEGVSRAVSAHILRRAGHEVAEADGVDSAAARCGESDFAVVVCDLDMPDGSGLDLLARLRAAGNPVPFILATGVGDESLLRDDRMGQAAAHLTKPVGSSELRACVERVLGDG